jgi:UV DNA damage endonuclease
MPEIFCIAITSKKVQCSRKATKEGYCTQHYNKVESERYNSVNKLEGKTENANANEIKNLIPFDTSNYIHDFKWEPEVINYVPDTPDLSNVVPYTEVINKYKDKIKGKLILGLCCIVQSLRTCKDLKGKKLEIFSGRTINNRIHYTPEKAIGRALQNICDLGKMLHYCKLKNIKCFRIGSDIFPRFDDPEVQGYTLHFAKPFLKQAGYYAKENGIRCLMHPCQLVQIAAIDEKVFQSSVKILEMHCEILDMMELDDNSVLIVHGGGVYGDKAAAKARWITQFQNLPERVRRRLVIENCENLYNILDCLEIANATNIPVVFDTHHYECYNILHTDEVTLKPDIFLKEVITTWKNRIPVMHVSNQRADSRIGCHSDYIDVIPEYLFQFVCDNDVTIHLEQEAKLKDWSLLRSRIQYASLVE